jgi:hypothetical protein
VCYQFCRDATESRSFFAKESQGSAKRSTSAGRKANAATDYVELHVQPRKKVNNRLPQRYRIKVFLQQCNRDNS